MADVNDIWDDEEDRDMVQRMCRPARAADRPVDTPTPDALTEAAKAIAWSILPDAQDRFGTPEEMWARIKMLGLDEQYLAAAPAPAQPAQPDGAALVEVARKIAAIPKDLSERMRDLARGRGGARPEDTIEWACADEIDRLRAEVEEGRRALIASGIVSDLLVENAGDERDTESSKRRNAEERAGIWEARATAAEADRDAALERERALREALEPFLDAAAGMAEIDMPDEAAVLRACADWALRTGTGRPLTFGHFRRLRAALTDAPAQPATTCKPMPERRTPATDFSDATLGRLAACGIDDPVVLTNLRAVLDDDAPVQAALGVGAIAEAHAAGLTEGSDHV